MEDMPIIKTKISHTTHHTHLPSFSSVANNLGYPTLSNHGKRVMEKADSTATNQTMTIVSRFFSSLPEPDLAWTLHVSANNDQSTGGPTRWRRETLISQTTESENKVGYPVCRHTANTVGTGSAKQGSLAGP